MPAFRQFASSVKPVQRRFFSRPANSKRSRSKRVERLMKTGALFTSHFHHVDQDGWAQTPIDTYTFPVQAIHQCDYILRRIDLHGFDKTRVANHGKLAKHRIEQMGCDVADLPQWCEGPKVPFARRERTQQIYQFFVHSAKQVSTEDWVGTTGLAIHARPLTLAQAKQVHAAVLASESRRETEGRGAATMILPGETEAGNAMSTG